MSSPSARRSLDFKVFKTAEGSSARAGSFQTLHGTIETPLFMPVGTQASVRNVSAEALSASGSQILLANTYHLMLRPGKDVFDKLGSIHDFMKWGGSVLTDSGGFQVFSLPSSRKITEEGVVFQSYVDGTRHMLSPETSIGMQRSIGSDIMMAMDVCIPSTAGFEESQVAMEQTHRWALRSLEAREGSPQAIFGIVQGACHEKLRKKSAEFIGGLGFDGLAIGGLAVGETKEERERFTELVTSMLPKDKPRYLMGVGTPLDLLEAVHRGVDMFDCIIPTQLAEQGVVFTSEGRVQIARGKYKFSTEALDTTCSCPVCKTHSRAYLHHLVKTCEPLSTQLLGEHNIHFYHSLMNGIRDSIHEGRFLSFYNEWRERLEQRDVPQSKTPPKKGRRPSRRPQQLGAFETVEASEKLYSIRHCESGEIMHPGKDPRVEARELYLEQSKLIARLKALNESEELVLWDVGLGAAFNAMAVVQAVEAAEFKGKLKILSFENDLDSLRLALYHPAYFPHLRHRAPHSILEETTFEGEGYAWELLKGDFFARYKQAAVPDLVFFDPYSSKTNDTFWTQEFFSELKTFFAEKPVELFSYSASSLIRSRLLQAGFFVAKGVASPPKGETTVALSCRNENYVYLGKDWLEKLSRNKDLAHELQVIRQHPQFDEKLSMSGAPFGSD